ncbi:MAG: pyridoxamine 5-phosphate oxidase family protein [Chloroflexota bacterium]|jgi:pyridoxamine 5'-phosphate oxidase family protein|nr:pyridoxamine 5-phosphate oxidase family protein [Chloroflexota bacterium]
MAAFTEKQLDYLRNQRLARIATADAGGQPHVMPVTFRVSADAAAIEVGGRAFGKTKKYRDIRANPKVAIVIDDLASVTPWSPRGIEVRGTAVLQEGGGGPVASGEPWIRIKPERIVAWGID